MTLYDICIITKVGRLPDSNFAQWSFYHDCGDMSQNGSPVTNSGTYICVRIKFKKKDGICEFTFSMNFLTNENKIKASLGAVFS